MRKCLCLLAAAIAALIPSVPAQESAEGLKPGQMLPGPFQVYPVTGEHAGRLHCLVCANGLNPTVMIFTREVPEQDKPLALLLKQLDAVIAKYPTVKTGAFVVVLSDDASDYDKRQALASKVGDAAKAMGLQRVVLSLDTAAGPKAYNLDAAYSDVSVFYHKHKVLAGYSYGKDGLPAADGGKIAAEVEKTVAEIDRHARPRRPAKGG